MQAAPISCIQKETRCISCLVPNKQALPIEWNPIDLSFFAAPIGFDELHINFKRMENNPSVKADNLRGDYHSSNVDFQVQTSNRMSVTVFIAKRNSLSKPKRISQCVMNPFFMPDKHNFPFDTYMETPMRSSQSCTNRVSLCRWNVVCGKCSYWDPISFPWFKIACRLFAALRTGVSLWRHTLCGLAVLKFRLRSTTRQSI